MRAIEVILGKSLATCRIVVQKICGLRISMDEGIEELGAGREMRPGMEGANGQVV